MKEVHLWPSLLIMILDDSVFALPENAGSTRIISTATNSTPKIHVVHQRPDKVGGEKFGR